MGITTNLFPQGRGTRVLIMVVLLILSAGATYWCQHVLHVEVVFTHFFYLPITLAGIWWGRRGTLVPGFLGLMLLVSHALSPLPGSAVNDLMRALIFILVGFTVGWLSDLHNKVEDRLVKMNVTKDKFFSIISHDLRSPFQTLMHLSQELCEKTESFTRDAVYDYVQRLCVTSKRLFSLVEDLLEWSKIETGKVNHQPELLEIKTVVEEVAGIYADYAARKSIRIVPQVPEGLRTWADRNQIRCVLRNLISNAIKFSHRGGEVHILALTDKDMVRISVADTGVGINPDYLDKIFRIDIYHTTLGTDQEKGSGLGLVLSRELVEMNGGLMSVQSVPDHGSIFSFTLPPRAFERNEPRSPHIDSPKRCLAPAAVLRRVRKKLSA